jgi:anaerobic magnesium-protoporphyrin IX monomethyl ester cyclase
MNRQGVGMRFERVLLVNPKSDAEWKGIRPHIGLGYLAQYLEANGIEHDVLDMNLGHGVHDLLRRVDEFKPDLVGMTLLTMEYRAFYEVLGDLKAAHPDIPVVVGGPHVTIFRERVLEDCPSADYAVVHEGEHTLVELCQGTGESEIAGLAYRQNGEVRYTRDRGFEMDLDSLPWPRYERFELDRYIPEIEIYSSRGCPHQCIFCPNRLISPVFRARSAESVVEEMTYWYGRGYRLFNFDDDNFNMIRQRVLDICDGIERAGLTDVVLRLSNGIRADRCDRELLARMKEVGFRYIAFGADAGNDRMLQIVKKGETIADIEQAVAAATELGYEVKLLFVVGTPYETWEDVEDKVRLSKRYPIQDAHFYNIIPYPGTELFDWIQENGYFLLDPEDYLNTVSSFKNVPIFETPELPAAKRIELFKYLERVRSGIHRDAAKRLFRSPVLGELAGWVAGSRAFSSAFYRYPFVRKTVDRVRFGAGTQHPARPPASGGADRPR